ncbi:uncharacterized protein [Anabrus simplex]|uniref:uncharacterized protein n=1 Tax=Anabrus simplex TaxID=316456 RepID=UPI0035A2D78B
MRAVCCMLIVLIVASAVSLDADLCSWCNCTRDGESGPITVVGCECKREEHKSLVLEQANMKNLTDVQNISLISCSPVELKPKAFSELHKLNTLIIDAAEEVAIATEVFNTLSYLVIRDVRNLTLKEKSLQNVTALSTIYLKKTGIAMLPQGVIHNLSELAKLKLEMVTIGEVQSGAIQLSMNKALSVLIEHSEIGHIQEAGIVCPTIKEFILENSTVKSAAKNSISIVADETVIKATTLEKKVTPDSFNITSKTVSVIGNTFEHFPTGLLPDSGVAVSFFDNNVLDPDWDIILPTALGVTNSSNNRFSCSCSSKEKLIFKKDSVQLQSWLGKNYCLADCGLPLKRLREQCQNVSDKDNEICKKIDDRKTAVNITTRTLPTDKSPTSAPPTTSPDSGCETILTSSLLLIASLIFTIL